MRIGAVVALGALKKREDLVEPFKSLSARNPAALDRDDHRHDAKPGAADRNDVVGGIAARLLPVTRAAAWLMRTVPEEAEGLMLHCLQQRVVVPVSIWHSILERVGDGGHYLLRKSALCSRSWAAWLDISGLPTDAEAQHYPNEWGLSRATRLETVKELRLSSCVVTAWVIWLFFYGKEKT